MQNAEFRDLRSNIIKITTFYQTFSGCSNLTGTAPALWTMFPNATMGMCFRGCTKLSNYDAIPNTWK